MRRPSSPVQDSPRRHTQAIGSVQIDNRELYDWSRALSAVLLRRSGCNVNGMRQRNFKSEGYMLCRFNTLWLGVVLETLPRLASGDLRASVEAVVLSDLGMPTRSASSTNRSDAHTLGSRVYRNRHKQPFSTLAFSHLLPS